MSLDDRDYSHDRKSNVHGFQTREQKKLSQAADIKARFAKYTGLPVKAAKPVKPSEPMHWRRAVSIAIILVICASLSGLF